MKKTNQNDLELEMINLDETAGWNQLEIESALSEEPVSDTDVVFQGEITYEEDIYESGGYARKGSYEIQGAGKHRINDI